MNYKLSNKTDSRYILLSSFHRGLFWGIIFTWTAAISVAFGASVTKVVYLDRKEVIGERNHQVSNSYQSSSSLNNTVVEQDEFYITPLSLDNLVSKPTEFSFMIGNNSWLFSDYQLADRTFLKGGITSIKFFSAFDSLAFPDRNFKEIKIIIQNTTNDPELAKQVYAYLQEREFRNIAIAKSKPLNISRTIIISHSQDVEAANYLKTTLNLGILDLADNRSFDGNVTSQLTIHLGEDAKSFATNQNFIYYEE
ncbi:hypothetical protein H1P_1530003 [Hyella patelloides LEGE 07179]|uniref:LytR/CpsA/Psr regulator C-terminal domain-containing protein n=1 Tax=Hyella patelloides LEGE 07179 TaxID=945734 RepID=A0A563VMA4_9CYAN|nr:LytR C-terminal domain-containing protein [Hyella patelloides]VEP12551.1 hypothetical protein H1P_1530003 [Hyella patelloides LEGE 07179]